MVEAATRSRLGVDLTGNVWHDGAMTDPAVTVTYEEAEHEVGVRLTRDDGKEALLFYPRGGVMAFNLTAFFAGETRPEWGDEPTPALADRIPEVPHETSDGLLAHEVEPLRDPVWQREFVVPIDETFAEVFPELGPPPLPDPDDDLSDPNPCGEGHLDIRWRNLVAAAVKHRLGDVVVRTEVIGPFTGAGLGSHPADKFWNGGWDGRRPLRLQILVAQRAEASLFTAADVGEPWPPPGHPLHQTIPAGTTITSIIDNSGTP